MRVWAWSGLAACVLAAGVARAEGEEFIFKGAAVPKPDVDQVWAFLENRGTVAVECTTTIEVVARNTDGDESTLTSQPIKRILRAGRNERHDYNFAPILADVRGQTGDQSWRVRAVPPQAFDLHCVRVETPGEPGNPGNPGNPGGPIDELLVVGTDGALHVFDAASLNEVNTISGDAGRVVAALPGEKAAATAGPGFVALYQLETGESLGRFPGPAVPRGAAFSADGLHLLVGGGDDCTDEFHCRKGSLYAFDRGAGGWTPRAHVAPNALITDVAADGQRFAASGNGVFGFYDWGLAGLGTKTMPASDSGSSSLAFGANGTLVLGAGTQLLTCNGACAQTAPVAQVAGAVAQVAADARTGRAVVAATGTGGTSALVVDLASKVARSLPLKSSERALNAAHAKTADLAAITAIDYLEGTRIVVETWDVGAAQPTLRHRKVLGMPAGVWKFGVAFAGAR